MKAYKLQVTPLEPPPSTPTAQHRTFPTCRQEQGLHRAYGDPCVSRQLLWVPLHKAVKVLSIKVNRFLVSKHQPAPRPFNFGTLSTKSTKSANPKNQRSSLSSNSLNPSPSNPPQIIPNVEPHVLIQSSSILTPGASFVSTSPLSNPQDRKSDNL